MFRISRNLLIALLIVLLLPVMASAQKEQEFSFDFNRDVGPAECALPGVNVSLSTKIYGTGAYNGTKLDWQIDDSGHEATLFKVAVNSPKEPVILVLAAYEPSIWHIGWTKGTKIAGVVISGYHTQKVSGLPKNVPVLNSTYENKGACRYFSEIGRAGGVIEQLFGREVDKIFPVVKGQAVIGEALPADEKLITNSELRKEDFHDSNKPLAGEAGLTEAVRKGLIRKATREDIQQYLAAVAKGAGLPDHIISGGLRSGDGAFHNGYVVLSPDFIIPAGLYGAHSATFILPEGLPQPKGPVAHCNFKSYAEAQSQTQPARLISSACNLPDLQLPPDLKVYAAGSYSGSKLNIQIDDSGHEATLMQITVNSPHQPAALLLGAYEPTIWHLNWTKGTKISAVIVSGYHSQMVTGLPKDIPVLNSRGNAPTQCPGFYVSSDLGNLLTINGLAKHLFNKDIDQVYYTQNGKALIGKPLTDEVKLETAEEFKIEKFIDPNKPLAGQEGVRQAVNKGFLRKATGDDYKKWLVQYARRQNLAADKIEEGIKNGNIKFEYPPHNAYVILSPDFIMPAGLYGGNSSDFIVPEDMPLPQGPRSHAVFYLLKDGTCIGSHPGCGRKR